jgi:hypothetical protein
MLATAKDLKVSKSTQLSPRLDPYWTILLLSPSGFFPKPLQGQGEGGLDWRATGKQNMQTAELAYVVDALRVVEKRWRELNEYIAKLLLENFMDPKAYVKLLTDNEDFTQSKRYFWIIGCLNEFVVSIEDNIKQWELFREARVIPFLPAKPDPEPDPKPDPKLDTKPDTNPVAKLRELEQLQALDKEADNLREALEDLRSQFKNKLTTVLALRDGVSCILII